MKNVRALILTAISLTAIALAMFLANSTGDFEVSAVTQPTRPQDIGTTAADRTDGIPKAAAGGTSTAQFDVAAILDVQRDAQSRRDALFSLSEQGEGAIAPLTEVAAAPFSPADGRPHSQDRGRVKLERTLRISALEALDKLSVNHSAAVMQALMQVAQNQNDNTLRFLAQVGMTGIQQGKPGKLTRMMDKMLAARDR